MDYVTILMICINRIVVTKWWNNGPINITLKKAKNHLEI